jgi:hypothetical protein
MARNITPDCIDGGQSFSLSSEQLAAIVEITGYSFGNEQGKEIEILCREYLIERDFERGAVPSIGAREICDEFVKRSSALDKVLRKAEGPNTAQEAVYFDLQERLSVWYPDSCSATIWMRRRRQSGRPFWRSRREDDCRGITIMQAISW